MEGQQESQVGKLGIVFWVSVCFSVVFLLWGAIFTGSLSDVTAAILNFVLNNFGWLYLVATTLFLVFVIYLAFSRFGSVKLGKDDEEPEFGRLSWFAMLFAAGMGIGLVFWGVAEPMSHYGTPPYDMAQAGTPDAAELGLRYAFFHWGLHPWAVYAVIALCLAYFNFRRQQGGIISSIFRPLLGDRVDGPIGNVIDVLAIVATLFGVAVSLGLGALQVNGGLNFLFDVPNTATAQIIIIAIIFVFYMTSAATGIDKGIRYLSNLNMVLALLLVTFIFVVGPTALIIGSLVQVAGSYTASLVPMSFEQNVFAEGTWASDWTLFYWATWIAWCPFVGTFIARISRGRTIREFVIVVLLVPTVVSMFWFSSFGAAGIHADRQTGGEITSAVSENVTNALFITFEQYPLAIVTSLIAMALVSVFFITSADSASFVLGSMSTGGALNPRVAVKFTWGFIIAAFAAVVLLAGGLDALQKVAIIAAVPFAVIMIAMCLSLYVGLSQEEAPEEVPGWVDDLRERLAENPEGRPASDPDDG
ncbi:MAG: BCCT family transporter [Rubrobacteraceae bacterium]